MLSSIRLIGRDGVESFRFTSYVSWRAMGQAF